MCVSLFAGSVVVVRLNSGPYLCKTDEVGELCVSAPYCGSDYFGLPGVSNNTFKVLCIALMLLCMLLLMAA